MSHIQTRNNEVVIVGDIYINNSGIQRLFKILVVAGLLHKQKSSNNYMSFSYVQPGRKIDIEEQKALLNGFTLQAAAEGIMLADDDNFVRAFTEHDFKKAEANAEERAKQL